MPLHWATLASNILTAPATLRADPYLRLADGTGYIDHLDAAPLADARLPVSVQLANGASRPGIPGLEVLGAVPAATQWFTARVTPTALNSLLVDPAVRRVQWAEGLLPQRPRAQYATPWPVAAPPASAGPHGKGNGLLLGVIDAGCPFAHVDLRRAGGLATRVVRLWDQQGGSAASPPGWGYGSEWDDSALNALIAGATTAGRVDEHLCYMRAGADQVLGRTSHGAHALGLLAAPRLVDGRPSRGAGHPRRLLTDAAATADIAFVQLPRKLLDSAFPPAVEHHVLNGLRYLLDVAVQRGDTRLCVSFAFESWIGPHDGSSWFDQAVQDLVADASTLHGVDLSVTVIAGNAGDDGVHRVVDSVPVASPGTGHAATVHWQQPPCNETVTLLELWLPDGTTPADLALVVTPPGGAGSLPPVTWGQALAWPSAMQPAVSVLMDQSRTLGTQADVIVLRLAPTQTEPPRRGAPHGEWRLDLHTAQPLQGVQAYIGRCTESMNSPPRGRQAAFTRRTAAQRQLDRQGTLSGFGNHPGARVATACVSTRAIYRGPQAPAQPGGAAPYAGFGPSRGGGRPGPSFGVVVEHGLYHQGLIGVGNRSGTVFRMYGTSVAAPIGARDAAGGSITQVPIPLPPKPQQLREVGPLLLDPLA